ncbi:RNA polymerase sigma factor [Acidicapsa acidisoli]|uniref:RNA polymerase sigma factor n=1 Tax=Acidicapsa acidisoli TaxID=1615681 RepID=UPI0037BE6335
MSTTFYNPNEGNIPTAEIPRRQSLTNVESEADNFLGSQPLSPSSFHDGNYAYGDSNVSDDDLITAAQGGDQQAFVELCGRHSSIVRNKILRIVRNQEDAEDALQDTLLRACMHVTSFRRSCKFSTWLTAIGVNSALMIMRKRRVRRETFACTNSLDTGIVELQQFVDRSPGPEGICLKQQTILLVRREVEKLPPRLRSVVNHYYGSECSLEETAKAQDISLAAAKSRLLRGKVRLRSSLARYGISKPRK